MAGFLFANLLLAVLAGGWNLDGHAPYEKTTHTRHESEA